MPLVAPRITCVLVVDDDQDCRENLEEILEREGYLVHGASNGTEAIAKLSDSPGPCIVLLDLVMPDMDGWEFLDALMAMRDLGTATHPVVVVSGAADAKSAERMPGVVAVLCKPFELETLIAVVRELAAPIGASTQDEGALQK